MLIVITCNKDRSKSDLKGFHTPRILAVYDILWALR